MSSEAAATIRDFRLFLDDLSFVGHDLHRPEDVLATNDGTLYVSDGSGTVLKIAPDGTQARTGETGGEPNGIALDRHGNIYVANIALGGIQRITPDGTVEDVLTEFEARKLTCANFVFIDSKDRLWCSFSTLEPIWWPAVAAPRPDGFVLLIDGDDVRKVADGIYFPNEVRLNADESYMYVAETMKARMLRYPVNADGTLGAQEVFGPDKLGVGGYTDGFAFDADGNVWVTTVTRNGLMIISADGQHAHTVFEDANDALLAEFEQKIGDGSAQPQDMGAAAGARLQFTTSVAFGGDDMRTVYVGSLGMPHLVSFRSPVPGLPLAHQR